MECKYCGAFMRKGQKYCAECGVSPDGYKVEETIVFKWDLKRKYGFDWKAVLRGGSGKYTFQKYDTCPCCKTKLSANDFNCPTCLQPVPIRQLKRVKYKGKEKDIKRQIREEFKRDRTSICPRCGTRKPKVYRKGYNWNEAFWGSMFGMSEFRYTAGMNANDAMCKCQICGAEWNARQDIRKR